MPKQHHAVVMKSMIILSLAALYVLIWTTVPCFTPDPPPPRPQMKHPPAFLADAQPVWSPEIQKWIWVGRNHCMPKLERGPEPIKSSQHHDIYIGPGLAGRLRITADDSVSGVFWKLWRVILRPVAIAPIIVGIALRSSVGL
jgi:hypothetical protein